MSHFSISRKLGTLAMLAGLGNLSARAQQINKVFVIAMENHNWTQPANQFNGSPQHIYLNPNAPFINNLVNGTASAVIHASPININQQVSYATAYHSFLATPSPNPAPFGRKPEATWAF